MPVSSNSSDPMYLLIVYWSFQNYAHGIDPLPRFRLLETRYLWLSMPTIHIWL